MGFKKDEPITYTSSTEDLGVTSTTLVIFPLLFISTLAHLLLPLEQTKKLDTNQSPLP